MINLKAWYPYMSLQTFHLSGRKTQLAIHSEINPLVVIILVKENVR